ncbi:hypothetical protein C6341_g1978 [Phytophthora cactorum]|nr:hypothetical protein C6341_g1978 [Phytophthora cactorum]
MVRSYPSNTLVNATPLSQLLHYIGGQIRLGGQHAEAAFMVSPEMIEAGISRQAVLTQLHSLRSPRGYAVSDATWNSPLKARFKARWVDHLREQLLTRDTASKFKIKPSTRPTKLHLELFRALDDFAGPMSGEITPKKQH